VRRGGDPIPEPSEPRLLRLARALLLLCLVGLATHPAHGQEDFLNLFASEFGQLRLRSDYRVTVFPDQPVAGQPAELGLLQQDFTLSVPLFQSPADEWSGAVRVRNQNFATGALLPDTGEAFPDELWNVRIGAGYRHRFGSGWIAALQVTVGSPSDQPRQRRTSSTGRRPGLTAVRVTRTTAR
jgi:hypothetical protein